MKFKGSKTEKNLYKIFSNKARNYTRYILFSEKARIDGYRWIQNEFESLAQNELAHAREAYAAYLNLLGRTLTNIEESILMEKLEKKDYYEKFKKEAQEEGFNDMIPYLEGLAQISDNHVNKLKVLNDNVKNDSTMKYKGGKWICINCGYIYEGKQEILICPVCKYSRSHWRPYY